MTVACRAIDARHLPWQRDLQGETMSTTTIEQLEAKRAQARLGGGEKRIEAQHAKGRLTARCLLYTSDAADD